MGFFDFVGDTLSGALDFAESAVDFVAENPGKAVLAVGATVASGGLVFFAAPAIAATAGGLGLLGATATTGTAISTLSGAALTNASLAAIGGGALAASGGGMAAGASTIAYAGAAVGGISSSAIVARSAG